ncbi:MAG TPA: hypothetical protein PKC98_08535 [Candidatus Melainabacteria bacterium]|nr:hypothetical protein [Candidatus Melainabacteria bacterium]
MFRKTVIAIFAFIISAQPSAASDLEEAWSLYRKKDYKGSESLYKAILKSNEGKYDQHKEVMLERLAALYYSMDLSPSEIYSRVPHCDDQEKKFLLTELIKRWGIFDARSSDARKLLGLPEPKRIEATSEEKVDKPSPLLSTLANRSHTHKLWNGISADFVTIEEEYVTGILVNHTDKHFQSASVYIEIDYFDKPSDYQTVTVEALRPNESKSFRRYLGGDYSFKGKPFSAKVMKVSSYEY